jgi:hypothetical protein
MWLRFIAFLMSFIVSGLIHAQDTIPSMAEAGLPVFLPAGLSNERSRQIWESTRREQVLAAFETYVYGKAPEGGYTLGFDRIESSSRLPNLNAERRQMVVNTQTERGMASIKLTLFLPLEHSGSVPVFLGMHLFDSSRELPVIGQPWAHSTDSTSMLASEDPSVMLHIILNRGYGFATIDAKDVDPDEHDGFKNGVHALFHDETQRHAPDDWGTLAAWAWGLSRALDALEREEDVDASKVAVIGHSRMGKAALWAGALDSRFAMVISNDSGCGGAAISRRQTGETVAHINRVFPHWFCGHFHAFGDREQALSVDQHMLVALAAPRPVYVASAEKDAWADPRGEFLSAFYASEVYRYYGVNGLHADERPLMNQSIGDRVGYHIRSGRHDITAFDWKCYLDFADRHFLGKQP